MLKAKEERPGLAILLILATYLLFTGIDTSAKWLTAAGMAVPTVVFIRYAVHFVLVLGAALLHGETRVWRMNHPWLTLFRASMLGGSTLLNFTALQYLPLTLIVSIYFTVPLVATALAALFLGEQVGVRRWSAIGVGLIGVLVITQPWGERFHWAMLLCLIVVATTAVYILLTRRLAGEETADTMQFWAAALPVVLLAPFAAMQWSLPSTPVDWFFLGLIGVVGWAGHQCWAMAYRYAETSALAPFQYVHIVYMALASWLIFHEPPTLETMLGGAIVIASGLYVWLRERTLGKTPLR